MSSLIKPGNVGQIIAVLANVGVIAGIVLLVFELEQNNRLLATQARTSIAAARQTYQLSISTNSGGIADLIYAARKDEPSAEDRFRLNVTWSMMIYDWAMMYQEAQAGLIREADLPLTDAIGAFSANPSLRAYWSGLENELDPEFVRFMREKVLSRASE